MNVIKVERDGIAVFSLSGRLDAYTAPGLKARYDRLVDQENAQIVVDLAGVTIIDSAGLGVLVSAMKRVRQQGGDLKLCGLRPAIAIIFDLTRLDKAFDILTDVNEAIAAFA